MKERRDLGHRSGSDAESLITAKALSLSLSIMALLKCCVCFSVNFHAKLRRHLHDYESEDRAMPGVEKILSWNETRQNVSFSVANKQFIFFQVRSKSKSRKYKARKSKTRFVMFQF